MIEQNILPMSTKETGLLDQIKESFKFEAISKKIGLSEWNLYGMLVAGLIGLFFGFLWKRYTRFVLYVLFFIGIVLLLQHLQLITVLIKWEKVQELTGIKVASNETSLLSLWWLWVKQNMLLSGAFVVGFLIGVQLN